MTISIFEYGELDERSGEPVHPATYEQLNKALDTAHALHGSIRGVKVYNCNASTAVHVRVHTGAAVGDLAGQFHQLVAADGSAFFPIQRKSRGPEDALYISATADT